jgi:hypothetical protein
METIESLKAEIARLKSSWHVETLVRKDAIIAKQEAENDRLKAELTAQQSPAVAVPEFNGWYCAQCQCGVDPSEVTYRETHTACGRYITDDEPPTPSQRVMTEPKTKQQLIADMRDLSQRMIELGAELDYFGGLNSEISQHASELVGAGYILETWANGVEEE